LRYQKGFDAFVSPGNKRKAAVLAGPCNNDVHTGSFQVNIYERAVKRPKEDEEKKAVAIFMQLEALPAELIWHTVTSFFSAKDVCCMSETCHFFAELSKSENVWKALFQRDFGLESIRNRFYNLAPFSKTWLWMYRSKAVLFERRGDIKGFKIGTLIDQNVRFEGEWLNGTFTGYGLALALPGEGMWDEGVVCEGEWLDNALNGFGRETFPDGEFLEGTWGDNALNGQGMKRWADGRVYKGAFRDSLPEGNGLMTYPTGGGHYIGAWKEGQRHGQGVMMYGDKSKYAGLWFKDKRNGVGIIHYADGSQYKGEWREDLRHGKGAMRWPAGNVRLYEGGWVNDKQDGRGVMFYADGNRFEGNWLQNKVVTALNRSM